MTKFRLQDDSEYRADYFRGKHRFAKVLRCENMNQGRVEI